MRARALERMRKYTPEWTGMSLHQHTTVLHTVCVREREWVDVCERLCVWGHSILGACRVMSGQHQ
jgi:hypothetical protein